MNRSATSERASSFPSPRPRAPQTQSANASAPSLHTYSPAAQRHTLSRLQSFFDSHRFDTDGPYDDLFVVLLSTAKHLVDVCDAQASQLQQHERLIASLSERPCAVVSEDGTDARLDALELRVDRLSQQFLRREAREESSRHIAPASDGDVRLSAEATYDRDVSRWRLSERLDQTAQAQERAEQALVRQQRRTDGRVDHLDKEYRVHATWCHTRIAEMEARLTSLETQQVSSADGANRGSARPGVAPRGTGSSTGMNGLDEVARAVTAWRAEKHAHPFLHASMLERVLGDDAAATQFTIDVCDRLDALEAAARASEASLTRVKGSLDDMSTTQLAHAQLVEARLAYTDDVAHDVAHEVAGLSRAVTALSERFHSPIRAHTPARGEAEDSVLSPHSAARQLSLNPAPAVGKVGAATDDRRPSTSSSTDGSLLAVGSAEAPAVGGSPAAHPYNTVLHRHSHDAPYHLPRTPPRAVAGGVKPDGGPLAPSGSRTAVAETGGITWATAARWLERVALATHAVPCPPPSTSLLTDEAKAEAALDRLCVALASASLAATAVARESPSDKNVGARQTTVDALAESLNTLDSRLGVLEAYSPHIYAVAARPPVLGVELEDVVAHPEERAHLPECAGGGVRVVRVFAGYPASFAGFAVGDVVVAVQGHVVRHRAELFACLTELATAHRARCQVRLEDSFLRAERCGDATKVHAATEPAPSVPLASVGPCAGPSAADKDSETRRAWQLESLLPKQTIQFTLWRECQFLEVCLLVPPSSPEL